MTKTLTAQERLGRDAAKAEHRRQLAEQVWAHKDLLEIFGLGISMRLMTQNNPHNSFGKHFNGNHHHAGRRNPTGSKLLRKFIRGSKKEQHVVRRMYAELTGRQYDHLNMPDVESQP
jgi:hypothetical protein